MNNLICRDGAECEIKFEQDNDEAEYATSTVAAFGEGLIEEEPILSNIKIEETELMHNSIDYYKYENANSLEPSTIGEQTYEVTTVVTEPDAEFDKDIKDDLLSGEDNNSSDGICNKNPKTTITPAPFAIIVCETCGMHFTKKTALWQHQKIHGTKRYQCKTCTKWFPQRYMFTRHMHTHSKEKLHMCPYCERSVWCESLVHHIKEKHRQNYKLLPESFCDINTLKTNKWYSKEFTCHVCGKIFNAQRYLDDHMKIHVSNNEAENSTSKGPLNCTYCGKIFKTNWSLKEHLRVHTKEHPFKCKLCNQTFSTSRGVNKHIRRNHDEEIKVYCKVCNKGFLEKWALLKHVNTHSGHQ